MVSDPEFKPPSLPVRVLFALKAAGRNPALVFELARKFVNRTWGAEQHAHRLDEYLPFRVDGIQAIAAATGASAADVQAVLAEDALDAIRRECTAMCRDKGIAQYAWAGFADACYAICRLTTPLTVVETGVGFGWTTAFILTALEVNGQGHLYSIELPPFRPDANLVTGAVVPERLQDRWTLRLGPQSQLLPEVLAAVDAVDFFHYDSDKTYQGMKWGYETVWPRLRMGGILMSDDVENDAFLEFSIDTRQTPLVVVKPTDGQRVALIRRS